MYRSTDRPSAAELAGLPTLREGLFADLKYDDGTLRFWLHRSPIDGEPYRMPVDVEQLGTEDRKAGLWLLLDRYDGTR